MELKKKVTILSITVGVMSLSFIGYWLYTKKKYEELDKKVDSKEDALKILQDAKQKDTGGFYIGNLTGDAPKSDNYSQYDSYFDTYPLTDYTGDYSYDYSYD